MDNITQGIKMPNPMKSGVRKQSQRSTNNLLTDLSARILKTSIVTSRAIALASPSAETVASTMALKEVIDSIPVLVDIIDDASTATDKTWSAQQVINYVAEKDDSEYFVDIADRDAFTLTPERDGFVAIVYDAGADVNVGTDDNGDPLGAIYVRDAAVWKLLKTIGYRAVSFVGYLHENNLVADYITNNNTLPLAASVAVELKELIDAAAQSAGNAQLSPELQPVSWDAVSSVNTATPQFKPKGQPVQYAAVVVDENDIETTYSAEFFDDNGTSRLRILMETPEDLSASKVLFTYMSVLEINA